MTHAEQAAAERVDAHMVRLLDRDPEMTVAYAYTVAWAFEIFLYGAPSGKTPTGITADGLVGG